MPSRLIALLICAALLSMQIPATSRAAASPTSDALKSAIRLNRLAELKALVTSPAIANQRDRLDAAPLHFAALYGSPEAISLLLDAGADPNARNLQGATPLTYAAWNYRSVCSLVAHGANVNATTNKGVTPLIVASSIENNHLTIQFLLDHGANPNAPGDGNVTALIAAAGSADEAAVQTLLKHGANPKSADDTGVTPLAAAAGMPDHGRLRLLLDTPQDVDASNTFGGRVKNGPIALVHLTPLMLAVTHDDPTSVNQLLHASASTNRLDIRKMNPLMFAIATDHPNPAVVRQLISAGSDLTSKDVYSQTAADWAAKFNHPDVLAVLKDAGVTPSALPAPPQPAAGSQPATAAEALRRTSTLFSRTGSEFFRVGGGCNGCHNQPLYARAYAAMEHSATAPDPRLRNDFLAAVTATRPRLAGLPLLAGPPGDLDTLLYPMMALSDLKQPADDYTDTIVHYLAVRQSASGAWTQDGITRPPLEDSNIVRTAFAIHALKHYPLPARASEFAERIERARAWLTTAAPLTPYEHAERLAGLHDAGVPLDQLRPDARRLIDMQHKDGGWAQTPYLESDAYATGLVLHTLFTCDLLSPADAAYRQGVAFLLRTQFPDGSWYVRSRAPKFQPYFESGFPFQHDQWISSAGSAYAAMALAPAVN